MQTHISTALQQSFHRSAGPAPLGSLATTVLKLLETAHLEVDRDTNAAKAVMATAATLIQKEIGDAAVAPKRQASSGGLANWQERRLRAYIDENLQETIPIAALALLAKLSVTHFSRAFKRSFGLTPHAYIIAMRLDRALDLILRTDKSLVEVSYEVGFADQAHLCKMFRRRFQCSPGAWRREQSTSARSEAACRAASRDPVNLSSQV